MTEYIYGRTEHTHKGDIYTCTYCADIYLVDGLGPFAQQKLVNKKAVHAIRILTEVA